MKKVLNIFLFALLIGAGTTISTEAKSQSASVSFSVFYNSLKPYGRWMNNSQYGQVWVSNTREFTPYSTGGHWAYTDYGWTWVSDYDWGWAPFHYGRWSYNATYGWYWIPGYEWAPAWVAWRNNDDYYGWAPLSPGLTIGVGVSYGSIASGRWVFAPHRYITSPDINRYYVPRTQNVTIIKKTTIVNNVSVRNNVHYVAGPRREDVERVNHTKIQTYKVANSSKPGKTVINKNTVNVYRPVINNNKTVVNNNKTTVNKNSNNTTVTKNSDNKTTNKKVNKTTNKTTNNNKPVSKKPQQNKKPVKKPAVNQPVNNNQQKIKPPVQNSNANSQERKQQVQQHQQQVQQQKQQVKKEVVKRKNPGGKNNKEN